MKEYHKEAIRKGQAYNPHKNQEITRKIYEDNIGFMREVFNDIDEVIERRVEQRAEDPDEIAYYEDVYRDVTHFMAINLPQYIKNVMLKFKEELKNYTNHEQHKQQRRK